MEYMPRLCLTQSAMQWSACQLFAWPGMSCNNARPGPPCNGAHTKAVPRLVCHVTECLPMFLRSPVCHETVPGLAHPGMDTRQSFDWPAVLHVTECTPLLGQALSTIATIFIFIRTAYSGGHR
jgi:hypothetical protein